MSFFDLDDEIAPKPAGHKKWGTQLPKEKPPVIPTATEFPEVAQEITEAPRMNHEDNQDTAVQALHDVQAPKPMNEGLYALASILRALRPIMVAIEAKDPRKYTRCAWFQPSRTRGRHGYLVATNVSILVAIRIPETLANILRDPQGAQDVANLADLVKLPGYWNYRSVPTVGFGIPGWENMPQPVMFPEWEQLVPKTRLDQEWTAKTDPALAGLVDNAIAGALKAMGKEVPKRISPRMLGDALNNTTARVYACEDALALLMPILTATEVEHQIMKQGVLDFLEGTK